MSSYFTMWSMLTIMAFGAAADPLIKDNTFGAIWAAYPSDPAKRDALHRCTAAAKSTVISRDFPPATATSAIRRCSARY